jgi:Zn ribbon nucleic-acid-binding protein
MRTLDLKFWPVCLALIAFMTPGCNSDPAMEAMDSDANGYVCLNPKCGEKYITARTVFMGANCPKCKEQTLVDVVGYLCEKDKHLTIRPSRGDPIGSVCEQCQTRLVNAMYKPKEKDLKAWGATKHSS